MKSFNVLSLFDGISIGQLALQELGVPYRCYASEVDKYACWVANYRFPETNQVGDVKSLSAEDLPKIDLVMGGSPCQGFSRSGKELNFEDPKSVLFFEFVRLLRETGAPYFLLENVKMRREWQEVISDFLGVKPILVNSACASGQNRERLYWTNLPAPDFPEDSGILLKDCLEPSDRVDGELQPIKRSYAPSRAKQCLQVGEADIKGRESLRRVYSPNGKGPTLTTMQGGHREPKVSTDDKTWRKLSPRKCEFLQTLPGDYTHWGWNGERVVELSNSQRYKLVGNGWTKAVIRYFLDELRKL